jgi:hypothetical protein
MANIKPKSRPTMSRKSRSVKSGTFRFTAKPSLKIEQSAAPKGAAVCPDCGAVYYDKHWHSSALVRKDIRISGLPGKRCEQCRGAVSRSGTVILEGLSGEADMREMAGLVRNAGKRAMLRDPEDRVIKISGSGSRLTVWTSENQLAASIGRQIDRARKGGKLSITWSKGDKPVLVRWTAPPKG